MAITNGINVKDVQALFCYIADVLGLKKTKTEFVDNKKIKGADEFFNDYSKIIDRGYTSGEVKTERAKSVVISYIKKLITNGLSHHLK